MTRVEMIPTGAHWLVFVASLNRVMAEGRNPQLALERAVRA